MRGAIGSILQGAAVVAELLVLSAIFGPPGVVTPLLFLWGGTMRYADWASAMNRRKREREEGYTFSYFIGYPRFLNPENPKSYVRQGALVIGVGVLVFLIDHVGGALLVIAGLSLLARQWVIRARWREEAMDSLDSEWEAEMRARAKVQAGGADLTIQDTQTAQVVSTADFVRHFSTR